MSRLEDKLYYFAKITIEAESPLVIASGKSGNIFDVELVRDANGLPSIPGTTITGILRHAFMINNKEMTTKLFGSIEDKADRNSSAFECSWAYVHNSKNQIIKDFISLNKIESDVILSELYRKNNAQFKRDHAKLNDKGVVNKTGKFDRSFVPVGARFTFTMGMWTSVENAAWDELLKILHSPVFRIGGAGRDGYGKIKVIEVKVPENKYYDISKDGDFVSLRDESKLVCLETEFEELVDCKDEIDLNFPLGFRIGGGRYQYNSDFRLVDMKPYSEKIIIWNDNDNTASFIETPKVVIPGSAIKGALRHRTAYHLARIKKQWIDVKEDKDDGLSDLFGDAETENRDSKGKKKSVGKSGKIWFTDLQLENTKAYIQSRNSIDRFTGGTRKSALFQEENVTANESYKMTIYFDSTVNKDSDEMKAFMWALEDLKAGRLAIGGGSGHGLGFNQVEGE